jgi:hypothetical protein
MSSRMTSTDEIRLRLLITKLEAKLALNEIERKDLARPLIGDKARARVRTDELVADAARLARELENARYSFARLLR